MMGPRHISEILPGVIKKIETRGRPPSRDAQRQMILQSEVFRSGNRFDRFEIAKVIGLPPEAATDLLAQMVADGQVIKHVTKGVQGANSNGIVSYSRPPTRAARIPWRTVSNDALGIVA